MNLLIKYLNNNVIGYKIYENYMISNLAILFAYISHQTLYNIKYYSTYKIKYNIFIFIYKNNIISNIAILVIYVEILLYITA